MFVWPCILNMKWRVRQIRCNKLWLINNPLAQHVSSIIMPIFRSAGKPGSRPCADGLLPGFPRHQPAHPVLKTICSNKWPALLKMGIMIPETCWANGLLLNHNLLHLVGLTRHFTSRCCLCKTINYHREINGFLSFNVKHIKNGLVAGMSVWLRHVWTSAG